jgi:hypothetical protein
VKLLLAIALVLMLSTLAVAVPESSQLGPYVVTFDMNTNSQHQLIVEQPMQAPAATNYGLEIFTDNNTKARLMISEHKNLIDSTPGVYKQLASMGIYFNGFNVTSLDNKTIDGKEGFLISSVPISGNANVPIDSKLFEAIYWMDSTKCPCGPVSVGTTSVDITSSYPQDVTENLLNSLHVVKGQATAAAAPTAATGSQDMPPAKN